MADTTAHIPTNIQSDDLQGKIEELNRKLATAESNIVDLQKEQNRAKTEQESAKTNKEKEVNHAALQAILGTIAVTIIGALIQYFVAQQNNATQERIAKQNNEAQEILTKTTIRSQEIVAESTRRKDFIQLALTTLSQPFDENKNEQLAMRFWAAELIKNTSPVPMSDSLEGLMANPNYKPDLLFQIGSDIYQNQLEAFRGSKPISQGH